MDEPETAAEQAPVADSPPATEAPAAEAPATEAAEAPDAKADAKPEAKPAVKAKPLPEGQHYWWGTGRRKASVARVRIRPGSGVYLINKREVDDYFNEPQHRNDAHAPLVATSTEQALDVFVRVHGGGPTGQAGAVRLGLARALKVYDVALDKALRVDGLLTVDARRVERKKYGQPGARRRFQFSKR